MENRQTFKFRTQSTEQKALDYKWIQYCCYKVTDFIIESYKNRYDDCTVGL